MSAIVETNNFNQILQYFNNAGELIEETIRFAVDCPICTARLALGNPDLDRVTQDTHEPYIILPECGHAFGATCVQTWFATGEDACPICRTPSSCAFRNNVYVLGSHFSAINQAADINIARDLLNGRPVRPRQPALQQVRNRPRVNVRRPSAEEVLASEIFRALQTNLQPTIQAAARSGEENDDHWALIHSAPVNRRNWRESSIDENHRIEDADAAGVFYAIHRQRRWGGQLDWERVEVQVPGARIMVEARTARDRPNADRALLQESEEFYEEEESIFVYP
ncbi:hypothetical protein F5B22DRAFT_285535 [Xylaria bambusicola]|uniref:uncharacterized protein n=1 Tax=Xylaria bambusicola TaxID=326684 RepID=UPI0020076A41|nr:uncharacterized protein F5B22DRAFT_285535 [Xylaria bambusicola]KAI0513054.1 hypothetical protein F5B22DRAFT_285535 [Xylaria bambusicola]